MTNHETVARIPYCHKIRYGITGAPILTDADMDGTHAPGVGVSPTLIELVYSAARDGKPATVAASVTGWWTRFGERDDEQVTTHFKNGPSGWPAWLAEEARLHDPEVAVSVPPPAPRADDQAALRDRIAERPERYAVAIHDAMESDLSLVDQEPGQQALFARAAEAVMALADSEQATLRRKLAAAEKIRENADFHLGQEMARRQLAEKETARLSADQAAVLNAAAQHLYTALFPAVYDDMGQKAAEGVNRAVSELRRLAAVSGPCVAGEQQNETPEAETVHAVPLPGSNGISSCCGRPPCEFVGERVTRDPAKVTCTGPAAGVRQDGATP